MNPILAILIFCLSTVLLYGPGVFAQAKKGAQQVAGPAVDYSLVAEAKFKAANQFFDEGKYGDSLRAFASYMEEFPFDDTNRETTLFRIAESFRQVGGVPDAQAAYTKFTEEYPQSELYALAAVRLGDLLSVDGKYPEALIYYTTASAQAEQMALKFTADFAVARTLLALDKTQEAGVKFEDLAKAIKDNPYATASALAAANIFAKGGEFHRSIPYYQQVKRDDSQPSLQMEASMKLGQYLYEQKQFSEAAGEFRFARNLNASGDASWRQWASYYLIQSLSQAGDHQSVLMLFDTPQEKFPPDTGRQILLMASQAARALGDQKKVIDLYDQYLREYPDAPDADVIAYDRLFIISQRQSTEIWGIAGVFIKKYPKSQYVQNARYLMASEKLGAKRYEDAAEVFDEMAKAPLPDEFKADVLYQRARLRLLLKQFAPAVIALQDFIKQVPGDSRRSQAMYQLALAQQETKKYENALQTLATLIKSYPKAPEVEQALIQSALINGQLGRKNALRTQFLQLLKKFPETKSADEANYWIGWSFAEEQDFAQAIGYLQDARKLNDRVYGSKATYRLILANYSLQKPENLAREIVNYDGYKDGPEVPAAIHAWLAEKFFISRRHIEAIPFYERLLNSADATPEMKKGGLLQMGRAQLKGEQFAGSVKTLELFKKTYTQPEDQVMVLLELSKAYTGNKEYDPAKEAAQKVMELTGEGWANAEARILLGITYMEEGRPEEALKFFKSVSLLYYDPELVPKSLLLSAKAYEQMDKPDEMKKTLQELKTRFPDYPLQ